MTAGWVAAATRGRALVGHLAGPASAKAIALADWNTARRLLTATVYGRDLPPSADRAAARRAAMTGTLWQLRVLAGWFPPGQGLLARLLAAPLELVNIEGHVADLSGQEAEPPLPLGSLAVAWPRVAGARTPAQVRSALARSVWGDPGGVEPTEIALGLRLGLARRLHRRSAPLARWGTGVAAVLVARERFAFGRQLDREAGRTADELLGRRWRGAATVAELGRALPESAAWALAGIATAEDLWRAEAELVRTVGREAQALVDSRRDHRSAVIGAMTLLLVDLRRIVAAIDLAGMGPQVGEVFDAVA